MITVWRNPEDSEWRIQAKGNFSLEAGGLVNLIAALAAVTLCLAGVIAWQGYWPVLAIAVVQVVLVAWVFVRVWERSWVVELIEIHPDRIKVMRQRHRKQRRYEFETAWAVVELRQPEIAWYSPRLTLRSGTKSLELGGFLTSEEKRQLGEHLKTAIAKHSAMKGAL
jgi:uncharacterized membrane protein